MASVGTTTETYIHSGPYLAGPVLFIQIRLPKSSKGIVVNLL